MSFGRFIPITLMAMETSFEVQYGLWTNANLVRRADRTFPPKGCEFEWFLDLADGIVCNRTA